MPVLLHNAIALNKLGSLCIFTRNPDYKTKNIILFETWLSPMIKKSRYQNCYECSATLALLYDGT
ncbi:hypothetical protein NWP22_09225 [Anabaenopsis tanganyikae CS-531]|uniref:Uncharacterized protein n=1 Tax=Anabaenopsis tanganyikae CS-531 TaxID=2785304 RepID=A0ABT6KEB9_9CYAN|nr:MULTISPECIES: hypothetical protein [Anabaenopsis]MDH6091543.1 hypothetical protein [Anabaenopsis arnoldii]MDH6097761.1 hypothetical protein [Anabaenopsis sp. FSS-46]MDH6106042.1 hypothetical protein [Anabaenopsis tanganyikae CS-531]